MQNFIQSLILLTCLSYHFGQNIRNVNTFCETSIYLVDTTYRIVKAPHQTFGYEILIDDRVIIRQLTIPTLSGIEGFKCKSDAKKVAELVIKKLSAGMMPPTVELRELRKMNIRM